MQRKGGCAEGFVWREMRVRSLDVLDDDVVAAKGDREAGIVRSTAAAYQRPGVVITEGSSSGALTVQLR